MKLYFIYKINKTFYHFLMHLKFLPLNFLASFFKLKKEIIFESNPDLSCNSFFVFKYIYDNHLLPDYKLSWMVSNPKDFLELYSNRVDYFPKNPNKIKDKIRKYIRLNRARVLITCVGAYPKYRCNKKQINIYLDHGSQYKQLKNNGIPSLIFCDYTIAQSEFFRPYIMEQYGLKSEQVICTGLPRNDVFFDGKKKNIIEVYEDASKFSKIILWVPTFRKANCGSRVDCDSNLPLGFPIIYSVEKLKTFDGFLRSENVLVILKPHPIQDICSINELGLTNFRLLENETMLRHGFHINDLMKCVDGIITDYSSIYYDYLLTNNPIGLTTDDYAEYKEQHGFVFENPFDFLYGDHIENINDLMDFIKIVECDNEGEKKLRFERNRFLNKFWDSDSSKRVFDFLNEKIKGIDKS